MDTFYLTRETEMDRLKFIYTAQIEAWTVDDWTRAVHLNHHLMMMVIGVLCLFQQKTFVISR